MKNIKVIGISGISGSGKSTLVKELSKRLNASSLYWDDFDEISNSPADYIAWYERGKDYKEFDYKSLADAILALKQGASVSHPATKRMVESTEYIVVDAPLGKAHQQTAQHIDFFIHIDVPLDVAMARRLIRNAQNLALSNARYTKRIRNISEKIT